MRACREHVGHRPIALHAAGGTTVIVSSVELRVVEKGQLGHSLARCWCMIVPKRDARLAETLYVDTGSFSRHRPKFALSGPDLANGEAARFEITPTSAESGRNLAGIGPDLPEVDQI